jgi:hypothetical protein
MANFLWVLTQKRQNMMNELINIPEFGKKSKSEIIELAVQEYLEKHLKSNNPQTQLTIFNKESINAIPNLYREIDEWKIFYSRIKQKKDYVELDQQLNMILTLHNKKMKDFG